MDNARYDEKGISLSDLMTQWPQTIPIFLKYKMLCVGCLVNSFHNVEDACKEHGVEETVFWADLHQGMKYPTSRRG